LVSSRLDRRKKKKQAFWSTASLWLWSLQVQNMTAKHGNQMYRRWGIQRISSTLL